MILVIVFESPTLAHFEDLEYVFLQNSKFLQVCSILNPLKQKFNDLTNNIELTMTLLELYISLKFSYAVGYLRAFLTFQNLGTFSKICMCSVFVVYLTQQILAELGLYISGTPFKLVLLQDISYTLHIFRTLKY